MRFVWSWTLLWLVLYHAFLVKSKTFPILFIIWKSVLYLTLFNDDTVDIIGGFLQLSSSSLDIMFDLFFSSSLSDYQVSGEKEAILP